MEDIFFPPTKVGVGWFQNDSNTFYLLCTLFLLLLHQFHLDHQALDPRGWGPWFRAHMSRESLESQLLSDPEVLMGTKAPPGVTWARHEMAERFCSSDACWSPAEGGVQGGRGPAALGPHVWRVRRWGWKQNSGPRSLGPLGSRDAKCFQFDVRETLEGAIGKPGAFGELWRALLSASICLEACASSLLTSHCFRKN